MEIKQVIHMVVDVDRLFEAEKSLYVIECMDCNKRGSEGEHFIKRHKEEFPSHRSFMMGYEEDLPEEGQKIIC